MLPVCTEDLEDFMNMLFCCMACPAIRDIHLKSGSEALMTVSTSCTVAIKGENSFKCALKVPSVRFQV